ncbi:MAG: hypothetical protein JZD41_07650 [Thermoproteus sp.]|nr:hypothetical protein [Thermoproteus sp.]
MMEVIQMLLNTLNELENTELKDAVALYDRKYLQMCLNRKACTLRYSMKGEKEPPEPLAVIRPGELEMNYRYRFLYSFVEPLERNVIIKERKFFVWP